MKMTINEVIKATNGKLLSGSNDSLVLRVCTDSREAKDGDLFFAIVGEKNDAHRFIPQVIEAGCKSIVISDESKLPDGALSAVNTTDIVKEGINIILANDTTKALQDLAKYYLDSMPLKKKIAVTGSVGKTSTRDMLFSALNSSFKTAKCVKNFNNAYGLPLSILEMPEDTEIAILEMGMSVKGSIDFLANLTHPDMAIITNIGLSHMENFPDEGRNGILKTKMEVTNYLLEGSKLIVNGDNDLLDTLDDSPIKNSVMGIGSNTPYELIKVKKGNQLGRKITDFGMDGIEFEFEEHPVKLSAPGTHNAMNASLVLTCVREVGKSLGLDEEALLKEAIKGLETAKMTENRLALKEKNGIKIIDDTYNAAPDSVKSAIRTLASTPGKRHIAILGDMFELGSEEKEAHMGVGNYARVKKLDKVYAIGTLAEYISKGAGCEYFKTKEEFLEKVGKEIIFSEGDIILVKASNGMKFREIVEKLWDNI